MADEDVQIDIKSKADNKGIEASKNKLQDLSKVAALVNKELAKTGTKAEASGKKAEGAFTKLGKQIEKCTSVVGKFGAVFNAFGIVGLITTVISQFQTLAKWIDDCRTRSARFQAELRFKSLQEEVDKLTGSYKRLLDQISKTDAKLNQADVLADRRRDVKRQHEDADLNLKEAQELATVSDSDPDAAQKRTLIANKYAAKRAKLSETRANEDRKTQYERLYGQKDVGDYRARLIDEKAAEDERLAEELEAEARRYPKNPEKRMELLDQARQKRKDARAKRAQSKELREQGKEAVATAEEFYAGTDTTAALVRQTAEANLNASNKTTNNQIAQNGKNRARAAGIRAGQIAEDEATIQAERYTIASREARILDLEDQKKVIAAQLTKEGNDVIDAENALGEFEVLNQSNAPGYQSGRASLARNLERERAELKATEKSLGKALNAIESELQDLRKMITQSTNKINQASSRINSNLEAEAAGD